MIVSQLHSDHFDVVAQAALPKSLPLICQPGQDATIRAAGVRQVTPLTAARALAGVTIAPHSGSHGLGPVAAVMGPLIGFSLQAAREPRLYRTGDTVFYPAVARTIAGLAPDAIVTHSCGVLRDDGLIVMDAAQTPDLCPAVPDATSVAVHRAAPDHATISRANLRAAADAAGVAPPRPRILPEGRDAGSRGAALNASPAPD